MNHTHIFDEFQNEATNTNIVDQLTGMAVVDCTFDNNHPDFIAAAELGRYTAELWARKLRRDFPSERFRVYYTEYDNPIVRFHKVRPGEPLWLSDDDLRTATDQSFKNALIFDTEFL